MRTGQSIRQRRKKKNVLDLDITSLLDVLVIMLVFLLNSYNTSGVILNVPKGVTLPISESSDMNTQGLAVQVSPTTIWVEDKVILDINNPPVITEDMDGKRIVPLFNELVARKEMIQNVEKVAEGANKFSGTINLIVDKTIRYSYIKKLMFTAAEAGYKEFKLVVMNESSAH